MIIAVDAALPQLEIHGTIARFVGRIDFNQTLMRGMLAFLLFAGALQVDLRGLLDNKWTITALATVGVAISTAIVGGLMWGFFLAIGADVSPLVCFVFGAVVSPTDPVAVMGLLKDLHASPNLEAQIAGESLFNDGIGVVLFVALASLAGLPGLGESAMRPDVGGALTFVVREIGGGAALGLGLGYLAYRTLMRIDDHPLELLITIALVMCTYAVSFGLHVSGAIAVVCAGVLIGNPGRQFAMSARTRDHVDAFWRMIDEIFNAVLFLLLGLQVYAVSAGVHAIGAGLVAILVALFARLVSVSIPIALIGRRGRFARGIIPVLTWSGLRGGISVALMLSLPPFPGRDVLLACTYAVVVFSVLVQGLTVRRVLVHYGIGDDRMSSVNDAAQPAG